MRRRTGRSAPDPCPAAPNRSGTGPAPCTAVSGHAPSLARRRHPARRAGRPAAGRDRARLFCWSQPLAELARRQRYAWLAPEAPAVTRNSPRPRVAPSAEAPRPTRTRRRRGAGVGGTLPDVLLRRLAEQEVAGTSSGRARRREVLREQRTAAGRRAPGAPRPARAQPHHSGAGCSIASQRRPSSPRSKKTMLAWLRSAPAGGPRIQSSASARP